MRGPIAGFRGHLITLAAFAAFSVGFAVWLIGIGHGLPSVHSPYRVEAIIPTSASLAPGARVTMAGIQVGSIESVKRRGVGAVVQMRIDDARVLPLRQGSSTQIRQRTPVGENYVSITPGKAKGTIPSDGILPMRDAGEYVDVDQILSVLQGRTRERVRALLQHTGRALDGEGSHLNALLEGTAGTLSNGSRTVTTLAPDRRSIARLVDNLGGVARAVGDRDAAVKQLAGQGLVTFHALASRDESLRALLNQLPSTLRQVQDTTHQVEITSDRATPVIADLAQATRNLRPAVQRLQPAGAVARTTVRELGQAAPQLTGTADRLRSLSAPAVKTLPALQKVLCQINPMIRYLKPYTSDVTSALNGMASMTNSYDAIGHTLRLALTVHPDDALAGLPDSVVSASHKLLHAGILHEDYGSNWNPFPKPGMIGTSSAKGSKQISGPAEFGRVSGYKYPRIQADC